MPVHDHHLEAGKNPLGHTAKPFHLQETVRVDAAHDEPELIQMGEDHDARRAWIGPLNRKGQVAERIDMLLDAWRRHGGFHRGPNRILVAGQPGDAAEPFGPGRDAVHAIGTRFEGVTHSLSSAQIASRRWLSERI